MSQSDIEELYRDGARYDAIFRAAKGDPDLTFWIAQAREAGEGATVLELASGTGRVSLPLAAAGFAVTGIDVAAAMLEEARRKAAAQHLSVTWVQADIRTFDLGRTFDLIIFPANTLGHLLTRADFEACMARVKHHLAPGGRFIIDVFVPNTALLLDEPDKRFPFGDYQDAAGNPVTVTHSYVYEPDTQIKRVTTYQTVPGEDRELTGTLTIRMYFPQELDALLAYNGFAILSKYGDYDRQPFGPTSPKQLIVCAPRR